MLGADSVVDAVQPRLKIREDEMADRQELFSHLRIAAFGNRVVVVAPLAQAGIAALVLRRARLPVANLDGGRHQRLAVNASPFATSPAPNVGFVHLNMLSGPAANPVLIGSYHARTELMQNAEGGFISRQSKLPLKLHRRHALSLAGNQIGRPEPCAQGRVAALHDRAGGQSCLAATGATGQHAGPRSDAERFAGDATVRAREAIVPAGLFQIRCTGRVIGKKSLELRERFRERKLRAVENNHVGLSGFRTQSIPSGCLRQADRHGYFLRWSSSNRNETWYFGESTLGAVRIGDYKYRFILVVRGPGSSVSKKH